ncbi:MAG: hypothetical protein BGO34_07220 [Bacteroidia bacterium 44-10]|jgi:hypothetical protein|nr:MAG: hypothetical protein BGO34_07220 [Bacteroidia bacterium 44-10]
MRNSLLVSSVVIQEVLLLLKTGKLVFKSKIKNKDALFSAIDELGIKVIMFNKDHLNTYGILTIFPGHNIAKRDLIME